MPEDDDKLTLVVSRVVLKKIQDETGLRAPEYADDADRFFEEFLELFLKSRRAVRYVTKILGETLMPGLDTGVAEKLFDEVRKSMKKLLDREELLTALHALLSLDFGGEEKKEPKS